MLTLEVDRLKIYFMSDQWDLVMDWMDPGIGMKETEMLYVMGSLTDKT